jgi:hypothetical protein
MAERGKTKYGAPGEKEHRASMHGIRKMEIILISGVYYIVV